jgi:hypothetical protein
VQRWQKAETLTGNNDEGIEIGSVFVTDLACLSLYSLAENFHQLV